MIPPLVWETIKDLQLIQVDRANERHLNRLVGELHPDVIYDEVTTAWFPGFRLPTTTELNTFWK